MFGALLLAAGESSRFGSPKALALVQDQPCIQRLTQQLAQSLVEKIIVVLGASAHDIEPYILKHNKIDVVYNKDYKMGQTSSVQVGLRALGENAEGFLLLPVDYPWVLSRTVDVLIQTFREEVPAILIPTYQGRRGHPAIFHSRLRKDILSLNPDEGLNVFARRYPQETALREVVDQGVVATFNTEEEFRQWQAKLR
jgi:molybdenum cofactor cytidylyltransferase